MMRPATLFLLLVVIGRADLASTENGPLFLNGTVVRVEPEARRLSVKIGGDEIVLPAEGEAVAVLGRLQRGDEVILTCRTAGSENPRPRAVTHIRLAGGRSEGPQSARARDDDRDEDHRLEPVRVLETDVAGRLVAVADEAGTTHVMSVRGAALSMLRRIRPGDSVALGMGPVKEPDGTVATAVVRIDLLARQPGSPRIEERRLDEVGGAVVLQAAPSPAPSGGIPLWLVNDPIPSVPRPEPNVVVVLPRSRAEQSATTPHAGIEELELRELDAAAVALAVKAGDIDRRWFAFRQLCLREPGPTSSRGRDWFRLLDGAMPSQSDDACRTSHDELTRIAREFRDQLEIVRSAAHRAGVTPGRVRATLQRHNIDL